MVEKLLTVNDLAEMLTLKPETVRRLAAKGEIPAVRLGRSVRFRPEAIEEYLRRVVLVEVKYPKNRRPGGDTPGQGKTESDPQTGEGRQ